MKFSSEEMLLLQLPKSSKKPTMAVFAIILYMSTTSYLYFYPYSYTGIKKDEKQIFNLASTGFRSTSRLAKSNPRTWAAIFSKNKKYIGEALEGYIETIQEFKKAIANDDLEKMLSMMDEANKIKKILEN